MQPKFYILKQILMKKLRLWNKLLISSMAAAICSYILRSRFHSCLTYVSMRYGCAYMLVKIPWI